MFGLHRLRLEAQTSYRLATERIDILAFNSYKKGVWEVERSRGNDERGEKIAPSSVRVGGKENLAKITLVSKVENLNLKREPGPRSR